MLRTASLFAYVLVIGWGGGFWGVALLPVLAVFSPRHSDARQHNGKRKARKDKDLKGPKPSPVLMGVVLMGVRDAPDTNVPWPKSGAFALWPEARQVNSPRRRPGAFGTPWP